MNFLWYEMIYFALATYLYALQCEKNHYRGHTPVKQHQHWEMIVKTLPSSVQCLKLKYVLALLYITKNIWFYLLCVCSYNLSCALWQLKKSYRGRTPATR